MLLAKLSSGGPMKLAGDTAQSPLDSHLTHSWEISSSRSLRSRGMIGSDRVEGVRTARWEGSHGAGVGTAVSLDTVPFATTTTQSGPTLGTFVVVGAR
jgi:hypothetical protein